MLLKCQNENENLIKYENYLYLIQKDLLSK